MPLYDTMTGLDLNIQIQITPSQTIPSDISDTFVGNLKQMADKALSNAVRLQRRQVSLWYLPRSKANPTEYYLLNIFLFSPSNVINYSAAVDQIKRFFLKMKTGVKLAILETTNIKLNFQFKHGLELRLNRCTDMSNGQTLKPLMEKGWTLINPGPHMTISELNWCFRTVFDLSDIEPYRLYILLKSTNDVVFIDQFDRDGDQFYLCLDLFIELKRVKEDFQITQEGTPSSDDDKDMSREIVADPERGLIVTGSLIAVILLLVILYKVKHVMAKKQFEESSRSNQPPSDFVELNVIRNINTTDHMRLNGILDDEKHINIVGQDNEASVNIKTEQN